MTRTKSTYLALLAVLLTPMAANAELIDITSPVTIVSQPSYTFGDYIFELVNPSNPSFNLISNDEGFIVSNVCCGMDFTLRRLDNIAFSLLGIRHAGDLTATVGGVAVAHAGRQVFQNFSFSGQAGVTNVTSILFSPTGATQISAFDVVASSVPEPGTLALLGLGLAGMRLTRRRKKV